MAEDSSELNELYGRGLGGKLWVMNGRLVKKEIKKENEGPRKSIGEAVKKEEEVAANDGAKGNVSAAHPRRPSSVNAFLHPLLPQLPVKVEEGQAMMTGSDSMVKELRELRAIVEENERTLKSKELLNSMLMGKLEQVRTEKKQLKSQLIEEQQKNTQLVEELKLEKEKSQIVTSSVDKELASVDQSAAIGLIFCGQGNGRNGNISDNTIPIQPSRAAIAAQLLGIDRQLLDEPRNEFKEKFEESEFKLQKMRNEHDALLKDHRQEQMKYSKVKQLYKAEQKVAAQLRKKLKEKDKLVNTEEPASISLDDQQPMEEESTGPITSPPLDTIQLPTIGMKEKGGANTVASVPTGGSVFKCPTCPDDHVAYSSADLLTKHQQHAHGDRQHWRHQCLECGRRFRTNYKLQNHMLTHSGEKPHTCQQCGKDFAEKGNLIKHERKHTGQRPYVCDVCQKKFTVSSDLVRHARVHTGETPYSCQYCTKQFSHLKSSHRHEKICPKRGVRETE